MKKTHKHTDLSNVECAHDKCAMVNGRQGITRRFIKQRIVDAAGENHGPLYCYPCSVYKKTGMTLAEQKRARGLRVKNKEELKKAEAAKALEKKVGKPKYMEAGK